MPQIVLVPTPIGNLEDITFRAIRILKEADLIAAEDTRTSGKLLKHYQIETPKISLHQHNEHQKVAQLIEKVQHEDLLLAVISDAGTPGISDPGFLIIRAAIEANISVESLPGPTAFVPALVNSGLPCDRFVFEGFLPVKKGRRTRLEQLKDETRTMVFYESPYKLLKTLKDLSLILGQERAACAARELTKIYEEFVRGTIQEIYAYFNQSSSLKGEFVLIVSGKKIKNKV